MRPLLLSACALSFSLLACTPWSKRTSAVLDEPGLVELPADVPADITDLRAARWHLLRAIEGQAIGQPEAAQPGRRRRAGP